MKKMSLIIFVLSLIASNIFCEEGLARVKVELKDIPKEVIAAVKKQYKDFEPTEAMVAVKNGVKKYVVKGFATEPQNDKNLAKKIKGKEEKVIVIGGIELGENNAVTDSLISSTNIGAEDDGFSKEKIEIKDVPSAILGMFKKDNRGVIVKKAILKTKNEIKIYVLKGITTDCDVLATYTVDISGKVIGSSSSSGTKIEGSSDFDL